MIMSFTLITFIVAASALVGIAVGFKLCGEAFLKTSKGGA